jgi:hypothetical protein
LQKDLDRLGKRAAGNTMKDLDRLGEWAAGNTMKIKDHSSKSGQILKLFLAKQ